MRTAKTPPTSSHKFGIQPVHFFSRYSLWYELKNYRLKAALPATFNLYPVTYHVLIVYPILAGTLLLQVVP